jgi:hypothetical protein
MWRKFVGMVKKEKWQQEHKKNDQNMSSRTTE